MYDGDPRCSDQRPLYNVLTQLELVTLAGGARDQISLAASRRIFATMLEAVMRAPSQFFVHNPHGRILNRFAKDQGLVDELLPMTMAQFMSIAVLVVIILGIMGSAAPYALIALVPLAIAFVYLRKFFAAASRQVKRLVRLQVASKGAMAGS